MNNALQWFRFYRNHDCVLSFRQAYFGIKLDRRMRVVGSFRTIDLSLVNDKRVGCQCSGHRGWGHVYKSIYHWENKNCIASTDCNYLVRIDSGVVIGFDLERHTNFPWESWINYLRWLDDLFRNKTVTYTYFISSAVMQPVSSLLKARKHS